MILHDEAYYESRRPVADLGPLKNCLRFIWDSERRAFLDRTAKEWGALLIFYTCFFGALFSIFAFQLWITLYHLSNLDRPYMQHSSRLEPVLIKGRSLFYMPPVTFSNPGLGLTPNIQTAAASPIIWLSQHHAKAMPQKYINAINHLLNNYKVNQSMYNRQCSMAASLNTHEKPCLFDVQSLGPCAEPPYGYAHPYQPCVYIKFNRKFDWIPIPYNQTSLLPLYMPEWVKAAVRSSSKPEVWLSCNGATDFDKEHIGHIDYFPRSGFSTHYFPFTGNVNHLSPIVALMFKNLTTNRLITVECYLWAENIFPERTVDFQLIFD